MGVTCYTSSIEPKNIKEALKYEYWLIAMKKELSQFTRNEIWDLVLQPHGVNIIGTK